MNAYLELVLRRFDCYGTWLPGSNIHVGELGTLIGGGSFSHSGELEDRAKIELPPIDRIEEGPKQALAGAEATLEGGVEVKPGEIIGAIAHASAGLNLKISRHRSAALILEQVARHQFADEVQVRKLLQTLYEQELVETEEILVTYVLEADSGFVAASSGDEAMGGGKAGAGVGIDEFELAKVDGRLKIVSGKTSETVSVAEENRALTPMYRAVFCRGSRHWWRFWKRVYTIEALVEAAPSVGALHAGRRTRFAYPRAAYTFSQRYPRQVAEVVLGELQSTESTDFVSESLPSLALAEQALAELGDTGAAIEDMNLLVAGDIKMVETFNNLGRLLHDRGDLEGAERQYERAAAWGEALERLEISEPEAEAADDTPATAEE